MQDLTQGREDPSACSLPQFAHGADTYMQHTQLNSSITTANKNVNRSCAQLPQVVGKLQKLPDIQHGVWHAAAHSMVQRPLKLGHWMSGTQW